MKIIKVHNPILDVAKFTREMPKHKAVVMVYMMDGCPHCDDLKPKWEIVKHKLNGDKKFADFLIADIDSQASQMLPFPPVMGFPSIKVLKGNKLKEYHGMREVDPLLSFLRKTVTTPTQVTKRKRPTHKSTAHKSTAHKSTAHKSTAHKSTPHKSTPHKSTAHKSSAHKSSAHKSSAHKSKHSETRKRSRGSSSKRR